MKIDAILPGLLNSLPYWQQSYQEIPAPLSLKQSLTVAKKTKTKLRGFEATVSALISTSGETEVATHCIPPTDIETSDFLLHAEFVFLRADIGDVVLYDRNQLELSPSELMDLTNLINAHIAVEGMRFVLDENGDNYLELPEKLDITTTPVSEAWGKNIFNLLPQGPDKTPLHRLINEIQMLLHTSPVNQAREAEGKPPANGVWFWQNAIQQRKPGLQTKLSITSPGGYPKALARYHNLPHLTLPTNLSSVIGNNQQDHVLLVLPHLQAASAYDEFFRWQQQLEILCRDWLEPAQAMVNNKELEAFDLHTEDGYTFRFQAQHFWNRWKKPQSLLDHL